MNRQLIFITGAAGFIGRHAARAFAAQGFRVAGISRRAMPDAADWGMSHFQQSPTDAPSLTAAAHAFGLPFCLVNCAGSGSVPRSLSAPLEDLKANVLTSAAALEFSRLHGSAVRIILPSSAAIYGGSPTQPLTEQLLAAPLSPYGTHKKMAEDLACAYGANFGVPSLRIRFFSVYGEGLKKQLLWDACNKARQADFCFAGTGEEKRDWLHVKDASRLLVMSVKHADATSPAVNGASGRACSVADLLSLLGRQFNPALKPRFSLEKRQADPLHLTADVSRIEKWGFSPAISLEQGVAAYVAWFLSEGRAGSGL